MVRHIGVETYTIMVIMLQTIIIIVAIEIVIIMVREVVVQAIQVMELEVEEKVLAVINLLVRNMKRL